MSNKLASLLAPLCLVAVVGSVGAAVYFRTQLNEIKKNPQKVSQDEVAALVAEISKIMILPEGETPTLATVADPSKLREQPFFAKSKIGDKVLLYTNARKAILYDPVGKRIIEVAPINIGNQTSAPAPAAPTSPTEPTPEKK